MTTTIDAANEIRNELNQWINDDLRDDYDKLAVEAYMNYYGTPETREDLEAIQEWADRGAFTFYGDGEFDPDEADKRDNLEYEYISYSHLLGGQVYGYVVWWND